MKISRLKISNAIANQTLKNGVTKQYAQEIAGYLLDNGRVNDLDSILRDIQEKWADAGYVEVLASSAHEIPLKVKEQIIAEVKRIHPEAKKINVTDIYDPEVIGGVRLNFANQQLDLSVEAKLNKFRQLTMAGKD
jgi:F-type H+-transporting ATPase subunit delta